MPHLSNRVGPLKVLVTGGSGAVGRHVLPLLLEGGHCVTALVHRGVIRADHENLGAIEGDLLDPSTLLHAVREADCVCHLAAFVPDDYQDAGCAAACFQVNALATLHLAELCTRLNKRLVSCSSGQAYVHSAEPVTEEARLYPAEHATYYLASKLAGELFVEHLRRQQGLEAVTFRVGSCYGPGMRDGSVLSTFMSRALARKSLTVRNDGRQTCDFVHVGDVARLIVSAVQGGASGVYNAGSGVATSVADLASTIREMFPELSVGIEFVETEESPRASFPALCMDKTRACWGQPITSLKAGLAAFRTCMEVA